MVSLSIKGAEGHEGVGNQWCIQDSPEGTSFLMPLLGTWIAMDPTSYGLEALLVGSIKEDGWG